VYGFSCQNATAISTLTSLSFTRIDTFTTDIINTCMARRTFIGNHIVIHTSMSRWFILTNTTRTFTIGIHTIRNRSEKLDASWRDEKEAKSRASSKHDVRFETHLFGLVHTEKAALV
jgi:hypothetical protein